MASASSTLHTLDLHANELEGSVPVAARGALASLKACALGGIDARRNASYDASALHVGSGAATHHGSPLRNKPERNCWSCGGALKTLIDAQTVRKVRCSEFYFFLFLPLTFSRHALSAFWYSRTRTQCHMICPPSDDDICKPLPPPTPPPVLAASESNGSGSGDAPRSSAKGKKAKAKSKAKQKSKDTQASAAAHGGNAGSGEAGAAHVVAPSAEVAHEALFFALGFACAVCCCCRKRAVRALRKRCLPRVRKMHPSRQL